MFQNKGLGFIKDNRLFRGIDDSEVNFSVSQKDILVVKEGDIIYSNSDFADAVFLVLEGEVKLKLGHRNVIRIQPKDFFGEKEVLTNSQRLSSAIANTDCKLFPLKNLNDLLSNSTIVNNMKLHNEASGTRYLTEEKVEEINSPVFEVDSFPVDNIEIPQPPVIEEPEVLLPTGTDFENIGNLTVSFKDVPPPETPEPDYDNFDYEKFNRELTAEIESKERAAMEKNKTGEEESVPADFWNLSDEEPGISETFENELIEPETPISFEEALAPVEPEEVLPEPGFSFTDVKKDDAASIIAEEEIPDEEPVSWNFDEQEEPKEDTDIEKPKLFEEEDYLLFAKAEEDHRKELEAVEQANFRAYINSVNEDVALQIKTIRKAAEKFKQAGFNNPHKFVDIIFKETDAIDDYFKLLDEFFNNSIQLSKNFFRTDVILNDILALNAEYAEEKNINLFKSFNTESLLNVDIKKLYFAFYFIFKFASHLLKDGGDINISASARLDVSYIQLSFTGEFEIDGDIFDPEMLKKDRIYFTGLQVAKKVIEAHKGNISFISSEGINAFTIELPYIKFNQD